METPNPHTWQTAAMLATRLGAHKTRDGWATSCPAHGGDNPQAFTLREGTDRHGHPCTLLYCHTHQCDIREICAALEIPLMSLFCVHPDYAKATQRQPRSHDSRIERLKFRTDTAYSQDDLAQVMLESEIVNDPGFLSQVPGARETFWRLAQYPERKHALVKALIEAGLPVRATFAALALEWGTDVG